MTTTTGPTRNRPAPPPPQEEQASLLRRTLPFLMLPLALVACGLASSPWLRAYPASTLAVPLFGAAVLSVLLPVVVVGIGVRRLWMTALIDVVAFVFYTTLVALREPAGFADLWSGLVHGPSQILTFALPLVSPRALLVAPVALCWLSGAVLGECIGRGWQTVVPYAGLLVTFGLSYAATARAVTSAADGRRYDTILAGALLLALLLMRVTQSWVDQDQSAAPTQPDGLLPLRGLSVGTVLAVVIAVVVSLAVQSQVFSGRSDTLARTPPVDETQPLTPLAFVAGLRPRDPDSKGNPVFSVTVDQRASRYITIGNVDSYNGDSWNFDREFRPSGGVIPSDPEVTSPGPAVTQMYTVDSAALADSPWMPYLERPQRVAGASVNIDPDSGMIVPAGQLHAGQRYSVVSRALQRTADTLGRRAQAGTAPDPTDLYLPAEVSTSLKPVLRSLELETRTPSSQPIPFLQSLADDLRSNYALSGAPVTATPSPTAPSTTPSTTPSSSATTHSPASGSSGKPHGGTGGAGASHHPSSHRSPSRHAPSRHKAPGAGFAAVASGSTSPSPSPTPTSATSEAVAPTTAQANQARTGGTNFASVLASILGESRTATPEQYATFVALVARRLGVPARVATGFRLPTHGAATVAPNTYTVTTADAWTWVELWIQGQGWTVLDPSPDNGSTQNITSSQGAKATSTQTTVAPTQVLVTQPSGFPQIGPAAPHDLGRDSGLTVTDVLALVLIAIGVVIVVILLILLLRKRLRVRRRRRPGDPRRRLLGAWQEGLDVLAEAGLPDTSAKTSSEIADATREMFGPESGQQVRLLGDAANAALFNSTSWVQSQDADGAWETQSALRRAVHDRLSLRERVGAGLRYHRPQRNRTVTGPSSWAAAARSRGQEPRRRAQHTVARSGRRTH